MGEGQGASGRVATLRFAGCIACFAKCKLADVTQTVTVQRGSPTLTGDVDNARIREQPVAWSSDGAGLLGRGYRCVRHERLCALQKTVRSSILSAQYACSEHSGTIHAVPRALTYRAKSTQ